ncbi:MAG: hypothetical protein VKJ02_12035 [Snowella sp.]|nr:hypothetical protein [Snowella sp.]
MKSNPKLLKIANSCWSVRYAVSLILFSGVFVSFGLPPIPAVLAQVTQVPLTLSREQNESYGSFIQRATKLTVSQLKSRFSQNSTLNQVRIVVIGENNGIVAPVLSVNMSRQQWLSNPNPEPLINYFQDSQFLLGFDTTPKSEKTATPPKNQNNVPSPATPPTTPLTAPPNSAGDNQAPTAPPPSSSNPAPLPTPVPGFNNAPSSNPPKTNPANALNNRFRQGTPSQSN